MQTLGLFLATVFILFNLKEVHTTSFSNDETIESSKDQQKKCHLSCKSVYYDCFINYLTKQGSDSSRIDDQLSSNYILTQLNRCKLAKKSCRKICNFLFRNDSGGSDNWLKST